jgi:predicted Zn-dependent peptidase
MSRLGKAELVHGELLSVDESLDRIRAVTAADVQELAAELASRPRSVVRVGPFGD